MSENAEVPRQLAARARGSDHPELERSESPAASGSTAGDAPAIISLSDAETGASAQDAPAKTSGLGGGGMAHSYVPAAFADSVDKYNILLCASSPLEEEHVAVYKECREIQRSRPSGLRPDRFSEPEHILAASGEDFQRDLRQSFGGKGPHLLAVMGHAYVDGTVRLEDGKFDISGAVGSHNCPAIHGVLLNACNTLTLAQKLLAHPKVGFVIATTDKVGDKEASTFSKEFFSSLFDGKSLHDAFEAGLVGKDVRPGIMQLMVNGTRLQTLIEQQCSAASVPSALPPAPNTGVEGAGRKTEDPEAEVLAAATAEEKALAGEILGLLENAQSQKLAKGKKYIKTHNLDEAQTHFEGMLQQPKSLSPEELKSAKQLLAYTLAQKGMNRLRLKKFDDAALSFENIANDERLCDTISNKRLRKFQAFHACALYEAGKQHRAKGNLGEAKKRFEAAKETEALPAELKTKIDRYLEEYNTKTAITPRSASLAVPIGDWLSFLGPKYAEYAESFEEYGYGDSNDLADADAKDLEDAWEELAVTKKPHQKRILKALQGLKKGNSPGMSAFKDGKRALREGNLNLALQLFLGAKEDPMLSSSADKYIERVKQSKTSSEASASVFSDNCTHILSSSTMTAGLFTATLEIGTKTVSTSLGAANNRELVMVLDEKFPENSAKRASLILALKVDVRKALKLVSDATDMDFIDLAKGSVIVHFRLVDGRGKTTKIEEEYLRQVNDKESPIYKGEVTKKIDQERTNKMTMQLNENRGKLQPCPYQVGDTITLAQITQDEKVECKVDAKLGEGATATVFQVTNSGKARALKVFKAEKSLEDLCEEASLMLMLSHPKSHPNVLRADFVWYEQRTNKMFFLLELVDGDDLQTWMDDERLYAGTTEEQEERLILIVHHLACGLRHLHLLGILHEDFKPGNVLMTRRGVPVIGDLGVGNEGTIEDGKVKAMLLGGTPVYASPKVRKLLFQAKALPVIQRKDFLQQHPITHLDDFFALGATILDMCAECGWRQGQSVAEVLASRSLTKLVADTKLMRLTVPKGIVEVLQACFSADESLTVDAIFELTAKLRKQPLPGTVEGMGAQRCANIRNNLGVVLFDSGILKQEQQKTDQAMHYFEAAQMQLDHAIAAHRHDARTLNNLGVVKLTQGMVLEAEKCFDNALIIDPDHAAATFNKSLVEADQGAIAATAKLDRSGAAGAVEDDRGKLALASAVRFVQGQQLEVHRRGQWESADASTICSESSLLLLNHRLAEKQVAGMSTKPLHYATQQQLLVTNEGGWRIGRVKENFKREFDVQAEQAQGAKVKKEASESKAAEARREKEVSEKQDAEAR
eukprot:g1941.t1